MSSLGTSENPLRVAIIGSGPSGFYAAEALLKNKQGLIVKVDMFERLISPHGLVRGGVAPDHQKIKSVVKVYDRIASHENFRYFGNVEFGSDVTHDDLVEYYHQFVYAVGAQTDRQLGIPGDDLPGSHAATEFVAWYNGHPDYRNLKFDLSHETAVVIGNGNVAMDVTRILASSTDELAKTDIANYALEALRASKIRNIIMLGRRGPVQAKFTNPELKEFGELEEAQVIVSKKDISLDDLSQAYLENEKDRTAQKNIDMLREFHAQERDPDKSKAIIMRFLVSPTEFKGVNGIEQVTIVNNELYKDKRGGLSPRETDVYETFDAGIVFRSIGYSGVPLAGVPFFERWGIIPNNEGRVTVEHEGDILPGEYVVGWIKRGPSGIIGTNKPDSQATVAHMLEDATTGSTHSPTNHAGITELLETRNIPYVTYADWLILDALETERGKLAGRPRIKFTDPDEMLRILNKQKTLTPSAK